MILFAQRAWDRGEFFFYIRIPEPLLPELRGRRYEEPIARALSEANIGRVTGGGSKPFPDGSIDYCGIDVVVSSRIEGLTILRSTLDRLGAPEQTVIEEYLPSSREHVFKPTFQDAEMT